MTSNRNLFCVFVFSLDEKKRKEKKRKEKKRKEKKCRNFPFHHCPHQFVICCYFFSFLNSLGFSKIETSLFNFRAINALCRFYFIFLLIIVITRLSQRPMSKLGYTKFCLIKIGALLGL